TGSESNSSPRKRTSGAPARRTPTPSPVPVTSKAVPSNEATASGANQSIRGPGSTPSMYGWPCQPPAPGPSVATGPSPATGPSVGTGSSVGIGSSAPDPPTRSTSPATTGSGPKPESVSVLAEPIVVAITSPPATAR